MAMTVETAMGEDLELGIDDTSKTHANGGTLLGTKISLTTFSVAGVNGYASSKTWEPGEIGVGAQVTTTLTVPGAVAGDLVLVSYNAMSSALSPSTDSLIISAQVTAADEVTVVLFNNSADPVTPTGTLKALVFHVR